MKYSEASHQTKKRLADALKNALCQKSFARITVNDIVTACGVNRKTFYYHFADMQALLCWMFEQELQETIRAFSSLEDYVQLANSVMDYVEQHERIFHNIINTVGEDGLKHALDHALTEMQNAIILGFERRHSASFEPEFRAFLNRFLTDAIVGIFTEWIRRRKYRNREKVIRYLQDIFLTLIPGLIEQRKHLEEPQNNEISAEG